MRKFAPLYALIGLFLLSCSSDHEPVIDPAIANDLQVMANASIVHFAVQVFAAANDGETPTDVDTDTNNNGDTLIDLMPNGQPIANPYTGQLTEPRNGAAANPGEIGYVPSPWGGVQRVYTVNGWGSAGELTSLGNLDDLEAAAMANGMHVRDAADAFAAENNGVYPADTSVDVTAMGNTLVDLLPGGQLLVNPFHLAATEPVNGAAASPGEVGHQPIIQGGVARGYTITVWGWEETILALAHPFD